MATTIFNRVKWTSIGTFANMIAKLLQIAILTRFLSKADFGVVSIALLFISFTEIFVDMGISSAVLYKQNISKEEYSSLYWFNLLTGVVLFVLLLFATPFISSYYHEDQLRTILPILSLNVIFSSISRLQRTILQKELKFKTIAIVDIFGSLVMLVSAVVLCITGWGIYSLVYSTLSFYFVIALLFLIVAIFFERNIHFHFSFKEIKDYIRIGIYQVGSSLLNFFSAEMDILIISSVYSMEILGAYSVCKQLAAKAYGVINPIITKVLTPTLALVQSEKKQLKEKFMISVRMISFVNAPIYFLLIELAAIVLLVVYGPSYVEYSLLFSVFCLNYIITAIGNPQGSLLVAVGRTDIAFYWTIFRIIIMALALYIGMHFDIVILAIMVLVVNVISIIPEVLFIYRPLIGVSVSSYFKNFMPSIILSAILLPIMLIQKLPINNYISAVIVGFVFCLAYWLLSRRFNKKVYNEIKGVCPPALQKFFI